MYKELVNQCLMELAFLDQLPNPEDDIKTDLGIDSLKIVELLIELEETLGIEFSEDDLDPETIKTVQDLYALISGYKETRN